MIHRKVAIMNEEHQWFLVVFDNGSDNNSTTFPLTVAFPRLASFFFSTSFSFSGYIVLKLLDYRFEVMG